MILCVAPTSVHSDPVGLEDHTKDPTSVFYSRDERILQLASPGDAFKVLTTEYGIQVRLVRGIQLLVFERNSVVSLFGRGSSSLGTGVSANAMAEGREQTDFRVPVSTIWDHVDTKGRNAVVPVKLSSGENLRVPAEAVRRFLQGRAESKNYTVSGSALLNTRTGNEVALTSGLFEELRDQIPLKEFLEEISKYTNDPLVRNLEILSAQWDMTYQSLATGYLEAWNREFQPPEGATVQGAVHLKMDVGLEMSEWDFDFETGERGLLVAYPIRIPGVGQARFIGGVGEKAYYSVFRVTEVTARVRGEVQAHAEGSAEFENGETWNGSLDWQGTGSVTGKFDFRESPMEARTPKKRFLLTYVGLGIFRTNNLQFEVQVGFHGDRPERGSLLFAKRIGQVTLLLNGRAEKMASTANFTDGNVPEWIWKPSERDRFNDDARGWRDYILVSSVEFGLAFDRGWLERINLADVFVGGPALWTRTGVETKYVQAGIIKRVYVLPGNEFTDPLTLNSTLSNGSVNSRIVDNRINQNITQIGTRFGKGKLIWSPSMEFDGILTFRRFESLNLLAELGRTLKLSGRWNVQEKKLDGFFVKLNVNP